ncbi:hypothetical protein CPC16_011449 [Podila verticillata]|nr:hypothetical protein CPC16_011449 [Podila verticillata]
MSDHKGIEIISAANNPPVQESNIVNPYKLHRYGALALFLSMITLDSVASYLHYTVNGETELFAIFHLFSVDVLAIWAALTMAPKHHRLLFTSFSTILMIPLLMAGWLMMDAAMGKVSRYKFGYDAQGEVVHYCAYVSFDTFAANFGPATAERLRGKMVDHCGPPIVSSKIVLSCMIVMYSVLDLVRVFFG